MTTASKAGHRKRLRERYKKSGVDGFHDYEMVELLLTYAVPRRDVKGEAKELVRRFKGMKGVLEATHVELSSVPGVGDSAAVLLRLVKEAANAYLMEQTLGRVTVKSARDVEAFIGEGLKCEKGEELLAVYLNSKNDILGVETIFDGPLDFSIPARVVIEKAFEHNARSIIFVHSLPGGEAEASKKEKALARSFEEAASAIDIIVHDYLIKGRKSFLSGRELGWVKGAGG